MKHMKIAALVMAATMALSPMAVMADTIEGDVNYVDQTVYKVKLPTTAGMSFTLDPQGLSTLDNGGTYDENEAGKIISEGKMVAKNLSSVDVKLNADFYLVDSADTAVTLVAADATVDDTKKEMQLTIATTDTTTQSITVTGNATGAGTDFTMAAATYAPKLEADGSYSYSFVSGGSTVEFTIGGTVAKNYDWSDYTAETDPETLTLNAVFKFTDPDATDPDAVITPEAESAPSISDTDITYSKANGATVTVDLGSGDLAATGIKGLQLSSKEDSGYVSYTGTYKLTGTTLTIDKGFMASVANDSVRYMKVIFNDTANTPVVLALTIAD